MLWVPPELSQTQGGWVAPKLSWLARWKLKRAATVARKLNPSQCVALLTDERAIEQLCFRDRDDLIARGIAHRAWPQETGDGKWRTWLTPFGCYVRASVSRPTSIS